MIIENLNTNESESLSYKIREFSAQCESFTKRSKRPRMIFIDSVGGWMCDQILKERNNKKIKQFNNIMLTYSMNRNFILKKCNVGQYYRLEFYYLLFYSSVKSFDKRLEYILTRYSLGELLLVKFLNNIFLFSDSFKINIFDQLLKIARKHNKLLNWNLAELIYIENKNKTTSLNIKKNKIKNHKKNYKNGQYSLKYTQRSNGINLMKNKL